MIRKIYEACNLSWDGCKTQEKWGRGGVGGGEVGIRCIMGDEQVANKRFTERR